MHHQAALALKPGLLSVPGLCSGMVRMTRAMRATKFQALFSEGLDALSLSVDRRVVESLPHVVQLVQARQRYLMEILSQDLSQQDREFLLATFNGCWEDAVDSNGKWVHWCAGCCPNKDSCVERCREGLRLLFEKFPDVPLLYRWKGWAQCQRYTTRGVFVHNFMSFLIKRCCSKQSQSVVEQLALDEDSADLSFSLRQEIRMSKTLAFMTSESIRAAVMD